jgi:hypothetical protein
VGVAERTRSGAEQRARSTAIAIRTAAQNGTSEFEDEEAAVAAHNAFAAEDFTFLLGYK